MNGVIHRKFRWGLAPWAYPPPRASLGRTPASTRRHGVLRSSLVRPKGVVSQRRRIVVSERHRARAPDARWHQPRRHEGASSLRAAGGACSSDLVSTSPQRTQRRQDDHALAAAGASIQRRLRRGLFFRLRCWLRCERCRQARGCSCGRHGRCPCPCGACGRSRRRGRRRQRLGCCLLFLGCLCNLGVVRTLKPLCEKKANHVI